MRLLLVSQATLRCDIRSGLKPRPPKPRGCALDCDSYQLAPTGLTRLTCHGDTAIDPTAGPPSARRR